MRVVIVGPGALGRALGEILGRGGAEVTLVGREGPRGPTAGSEVAIVAVKAHATAEAIRGVFPLLGAATAVVSLQNGLGNVERIAEVCGPERTFGGSTTIGARRLPSGEVLHTGRGETRIAPFERGRIERAREVARRLAAHGLPAEAVEDLPGLLWQKLAVSCALNALTGLLAVENGEVARLEGARGVAIEAAREVGTLARRFGLKLEREPGELAIEVARATARNRSSLLQDLEAGRRTEVEFMNGAAVERGAGVGLELPVNRTLLQLVRALEALRRPA